MSSVAPQRRHAEHAASGGHDVGTVQPGAGVEDDGPIDAVRGVEPRDHVALADVAGIALGGPHHADDGRPLLVRYRHLRLHGRCRGR